MIEVVFIYQNEHTIIKANMDELFERIIDKFISTSNLNVYNVDINKLYYLADGQFLDKNKNLGDLMNKMEKSNKKIVILVMSFNSTIRLDNRNIVKSNEIICPKCKEICKYDITDYKIKLYDCINGHIIDGIKLKEFDDTQNIDLSNIKCGICKNNNKSNVFNNQFYRCNDCNINICSLCSSIHDERHMIINYDTKNYICNKHNKSFDKYCEDCRKDICPLCQKEHSNHNKLSYKDMFIDVKEIRKKMKVLYDKIIIFRENVKEIIDKLKDIITNIDIYYIINSQILDNFENKMNYTKIININAINNFIDKEIENFGNKYDINNLIDLYNNMNQINNIKTEISIVYKPKEKANLFGSYFVKNNLEKCKILYKNNEYDLTEHLGDIEPNYNNKKEYSIKLKGINNVTDMSYMFSGCNSLISLPDLSKLDTSKVNNMYAMFFGCNSLPSLPDISKWNISNVNNLGYMFYGCNLLKSLPDISIWNTSNVISMSSMFNGCKSLLSLPDISKWDTSKVTNINSMFSKCKLLTSLPDIAEWDLSNVTNISSMFNGCNALLYLPDLSKWNTSNVNNMSYLFYGCNSLSVLPDISKWNISNVTSMIYMFSNCSSLSSLPDIYKWDISNVNLMNSMFDGCKKSLNIPPKFKK